MKGSRLFIAFGCLVVIFSLASCSSTRYQEGFSYIPANPGPDMGSSEIQIEGVRGKVEEVQPMEGDVVKVEANEQELTELVHTSIQVQHSQPAQTDFKASVREVARQYGEKHEVRYSEKQLRKLDKVASRLEKMQHRKQGPDVTWGPSNNLEWAILGAAAVGLFVGIFGIGFGWFIFAIAALAYLYFKLLHNN